MNFDRVAPHYDWMEAVTAGGLLQRARTAWLGEMAGRRRILSVGEGHGRFAAACCARHPGAHLTCVDESPRMLARARRRVARMAGASGIEWIQATVPAWRPSASRHDALVTCFFLDCFPPAELAEIVAALAAGATPDAVWVMVDFTVPPCGIRRTRALGIHALMYAFFRVVTQLPAHRLTAPDELIRARGFHLEARREYSLGLLRADLWRRPG